MVRINKDSGFKKLNAEKKRVIHKASKKLLNIIYTLDDFTANMINNPAIHDAYGNFYVYKFSTRDFSVRLLYRYVKDKDILEIHRFHFKEGDSDNSKYIEYFEKYVEDYHG